MCGTIRAYQVGLTDAFEAYDDGQVTAIDGPYVSGVSLTHGSPRQHIWTFAAGASEHEPTRDDACPCDATIGIAIPPLILWVKTISVKQDQTIHSGMVKGVLALVSL